jgi:glycosyltransferase involved in cell wall biosynthesis
MNELVSIIIPVYNREDLIRNTLESIKEQSYLNWECIIVDDGSTDNTLQIINNFVKQDARFKLFLRPTKVPKGANSCRNLGFSKSTGFFVNWFDSDDTMHQDFIAKKLAAFVSDKDADLVLSKTVRVEKNKEKVFERRTNLTNNLLEDFITRKVSWYTFDGMFRKSFLKDGGLWDEYLKGGQDRDFYIKILIRKPKVIIIDFYATYYLCHNESISEKLYRKTAGDQYFIYNFSHFESLIKQVGFLKKADLLSENLKNHYFIEIKKKLPSVFYIRKKATILYITLFKLSSINRNYLKQWIKIFLASFSFLFLGKGEKLLK